MKKKTIKNYIAFTLTEMTMVLLIMSVLAAVTAPIVKHAVSDVVNTSEADSSDNSPWKKLSNLSGIFYSSVGNGIVSVGTIPSGAPKNYNYPAMIIQSNGGDKTNLVSQLGFYNTSTSNSQRMSFDRYNNIAIGRDIKSNADNNAISTLPYGKIEIGSNIGSGRLRNSTQAVIIGQNVLNGSYASANHTISMGSVNSNQGSDAGLNHDNSINIGHGTAVLHGFENQNSINVGYYAANNSYYNNDSINIGSYAGVGTYAQKSIFLGSFAGYGISSIRNLSNIIIGRYAGYVERAAFPAIIYSTTNYGNVYIGNLAGAFLTPPHKNASSLSSTRYDRANTVAIGLGTLASSYKYYLNEDRVSNTCTDMSGYNACKNKYFPSSLAFGNDIAIGAFAGSNIQLQAHQDKRRNHNLILIGAYAGADSSLNGGASAYQSEPTEYLADNSYTDQGFIAIGPFSGYTTGYNRDSNAGFDNGLGHSGAPSSITIGYYAGYSNKRPGIIAIGPYAGSTTESDGSSSSGTMNPEDTGIFIGEFAGYRTTGGRAIGIGRYACANSIGWGNMCFGNFPYAMMNGDWFGANGTYYTLKTTTNATIWPQSETSYFYAGAGVGAASSDMILAAKYVFVHERAAQLIASDARSKRKINLSKHNLKDFRKFNIYNYSLKSDKKHIKQIGVIAQEYKKAFPEGFIKAKVYAVDTDWLYYSMINAVKDLDKLIQEFQVKFDEYINNFESVKARIDVLEKAVAQEKTNNENMRKQLEQINSKLNAKK